MIKKIALFLLIVSSLHARTCPDQLSVYGGAFDLFRERHRTFEFGMEYKFDPAWGAVYQFLDLRPLVGIMSNATKSAYLYGGINFDLYLAECFIVAPGFAAGWYGRGDGKNLGFPLEFRTGCEAAWQFCNHSRLGVHFYHISNAGLGKHNPGSESLVIFYDIPVQKGFPFSSPR